TVARLHLRDALRSGVDQTLSKSDHPDTQGHLRATTRSSRQDQRWIRADAASEDVFEARLEEILTFRRDHDLKLKLMRDLQAAAETLVLNSVRGSVDQMLESLRTPFKLAGRDFLAAATVLKPFETNVLNSNEITFDMAKVAQSPTAAAAYAKLNASARKMELIIRARDLLALEIPDPDGVSYAPYRRYFKGLNVEVMRRRPIPASGPTRYLNMRRWTGCSFVLQRADEMATDAKAMEPLEAAARSDWTAVAAACVTSD
ncbi:MAG TPA: hypothetical protein VHN81_07460, partial [Edaphobacter sp.]|nr:hypothetical protein [Edaphobacter sp.]